MRYITDGYRVPRVFTALGQTVGKGEMTLVPAELALPHYQVTQAVVVK